jgi:RNA polymerase sigma-70 factor (ECF subfamily)
MATMTQAQASRDRLWAGYVRGIAEGDEDALGRFYDESSRFVYGLALRWLRDPSEAEEVTIDVYLQVWRSAKRFDPTRGAAPSWLAVLTRSRAIDRLRAIGSRRRFETQWEDWIDPFSHKAAPDEATASIEREVRVRGAIAALPERERRAIELVFFAGLSHTEAARRLEEPLGTVKSRIRSGMSRMRPLLAES